MTNPTLVEEAVERDEIDDLMEQMETAAGNVELARESGVVGHLAGWEHLTMREALLYLKATDQELAGEREENAALRRRIAELELRGIEVRP